MAKILIFGKRSNLSQRLSQKIEDTTLISTKEYLQTNEFFKKYQNEELYIIINAFFPANRLNDFEQPQEYISSSLVLLSKILEEINCCNLNIRKILYTSSSSVYGNNNFCQESDLLMPLSLHASLKISSEKLLSGFCTQKKIPYVIPRVFNMYGGSDTFSVVSKIIDAVNDNKSITLINNGNAIRDFIHIDDVVNVYQILLFSSTEGVINVASGKGVSVRNILDFLTLKGFSIETQNLQRDEIKVSTANIKILTELVNIEEFNNLFDFILEKVKGK